MVGRKARRVLGLAVGLLRCPGRARRGSRAHRWPNAGCVLVSRRHAELCAKRPAGGGDGSRADSCDRPGRGGEPVRPELRRTGRRGGQGQGGPARPGRDPRGPGRGVPAQHPGGDHRPAGHRQPRRDLVVLLAGLRPGQRDRPVRADHPEGPARGRAVPLRRQGVRPQPGGGRRRRGAARPGRGHHGGRPGPRRLAFESLPGDSGAALEFEAVAYGHPLWVLYSSGTTGLPKAIVHSHGGIVQEHLKALCLHQDLGAGDVFFWYTTTGWMMWNFLAGGLLAGVTIVAYDGSATFPETGALWRMAADAGVTYFGTGAPYLLACAKAGLAPGRDHDLSRLRGVGSTGSPLPPEGFRWVYQHVGGDLLLGSFSGGTDVCTGFV